MPVNSTARMVSGPAGQLQAQLDCPESISPGDTVQAIAVVCHPHPQFQGTMLNKVVHTLSRTATDVGVPALRFNYRGVGQSSGAYDEGRGETDDAQAACEEMRALFGDRPLILMGFSFGAGVVLRLAERLAPASLIAAAPPVGRFGVPESIGFVCPWQIIQGTGDELVDAEAVSSWAAVQQPPPELVEMDGVSHFFHGSLTALRREAGDFLTRSVELSVPAA